MGPHRGDGLGTEPGKQPPLSDDLRRVQSVHNQHLNFITVKCNITSKVLISIKRQDLILTKCVGVAFV